MTYLPDLSPFTYSRKPKCGEFDVVSIGWLDGEHEYAKGEIDPKHWSEIKKILDAHGPINLTCGVHKCELCGKETGNGEYHAYNPQTNKIYIAPALIVHYIQMHQYAPPEEYFDAVFHRLLKEGDCSEIEGLYDALDYGLHEETLKEKVHTILKI